MKSPAYQTTEITSTSISAKYPYDFVCKCLASNSVEKAEQEILTKLRDEVVGMLGVTIDIEDDWTPRKDGRWLDRDDVLALIADLEKGGE